MTENNYYQLEKSSRNKIIIYRWILFIVLGLFAIYYIAPLYVMIVTSFKTLPTFSSVPFYLPFYDFDASFSAWKTIFDDNETYVATWNV